MRNVRGWCTDRLRSSPGVGIIKRLADGGARAAAQASQQVAAAASVLRGRE